MPLNLIQFSHVKIWLLSAVVLEVGEFCERNYFS